MRKLIVVRFAFVALLVIGAGCSREVSFNKDVFPIFQERCMTCHAPGSPGCVASGFSLATYDSLMKGTKFGAMIIPGSSLDSNLLRLVKHRGRPINRDAAESDAWEAVGMAQARADQPDRDLDQSRREEQLSFVGPRPAFCRPCAA
jgi:hypothetical protein